VGDAHLRVAPPRFTELDHAHREEAVSAVTRLIAARLCAEGQGRARTFEVVAEGVR